ncbi:phosphoribosylanthranilate isomerase [Agathobacter sp.]
MHDNSTTKIKIKICGLTSPDEAAYLNKNHVDFAGMVLFFPKSKRNISIEQAKEIIRSLDSSIKSVAVVVSPTNEQICEIADAGFDYVQIHGAIPDSTNPYATNPDSTGEAAGTDNASWDIPILKAFNVSDMGSYENYHNDPRIVGYVFDAQEPGSGKTFDWNLVDNIPRDEKLLILAGGLNPSNVRTAIQKVHPDGVDVSSGVENDDGDGKNPYKVDKFVSAVSM